MSLFIYVSPQSVIIRKYKLTFPFIAPPPNVTKAAVNAYSLLLSSVSTRVTSTPKEREEIIAPLQHYGFALFKSIIPESLRSRIYQEAGLFIFGTEPRILNISWELLYDGRAFFALTQGVVRVNYSKQHDFVGGDNSEISHLKLSLNAYHPIIIADNIPDADGLNTGSRFVTQVEHLPSGVFSTFPYIKSKIDGNASKETIFDELKSRPDIFLFSGFDSGEGWMLSGPKQTNKRLSWFDQEFQAVLSTSIQNGLRIMILVTSDLLENPKHFVNDAVSRYFDAGIPYLISVHGRIQRFILNLTRQENILKAHRLAINSIQADIPLSCDWSWIQLHVNKSLLEKDQIVPLRPFNLILDARSEKQRQVTIHQHLNVHRRFAGHHETLRQLLRVLDASASGCLINLMALNGYSAEEYMFEAFRRLKGQTAHELYLLYYKRWGYHGAEIPKVPRSISQQFSFLLKEEAIFQYFDQCTLQAEEAAGEEVDKRFLVVYYPPDKADPVLDQWMKTKLDNGWTIILLSNHQKCTNLSCISITTGDLTLGEINNCFEDSLPKPWMDCLESDFPHHMLNTSLMMMVKSFGDQKLIDLVYLAQNEKTVWKEAFVKFISTLPRQRLRILFFLFLLRVPVSRKYLRLLLSGKKIDVDLNYLHRLGLLDCNLNRTKYWMPIHIRAQITKHKLFSSRQIIAFGEEVLQKQISVIKRDQLPDITKIMGFQYCLTEISEFGAFESALQRSIQLLKKLSDSLPKMKFVFMQNIWMSLQLAYYLKKRALVQNSIFSVIEILSQLSLQKESTRLYQWLLKAEEKNRNWPLVAEIQVKLAEIYTKLNQKEKAIGLITSSMQLNNDIKSFSSRTHNLITIALLLLDIDETEKLNSLLGSVHFDFNLLSDENVAKLWLIDGHILFHEKKYKEAARSLAKVAEFTNLSLSDSLLAKTYHVLSVIYDHQGSPEKKREYEQKAAEFFSFCGDKEMPARYHEQLLRNYAEKGVLDGSIKHLEKMYQSARAANKQETIRDIAKQLGTMYYELGNQEKSAEFYKVAQGI